MHTLTEPSWEVGREVGALLSITLRYMGLHGDLIQPKWEVCAVLSIRSLYMGIHGGADIAKLGCGHSPVNYMGIHGGSNTTKLGGGCYPVNHTLLYRYTWGI